MRLPLQTSLLRYNQTSWDTVLSPPTGKQIHLYEAKVINGAAGSIAMGLLKRLSLGATNLYSITQLSTPDALLDNTIKTGNPGLLILGGVNNDGFMIQNPVRFDFIGLNISTAAAGGTYQLEYFNGTSFVAVTGAVIPSLSSTGRVIFVFQAPHDWVPGTTAAVGGDSTQYSIILRATTAPAALSDIYANQIILGKFLDYLPTAVTQSSITNTFFAFQPFVLSGEEGVQPYFSAAAVTNLIRLTYSVQE